MSRIEQKILASLIHNEEYIRKVAPFILPEYFSESGEKILAQEILSFFSTYNKQPTQEILKIEVANRRGMGEREYRDILTAIDTLHEEKLNYDWLIQSTEKFCQTKAVYNAIMGSIAIIDGKDAKRTPEAIPSILQDALAVSFNQYVGHDYFLDSDMRFDFYHRIEEKLSFGLDLLDKITAGGMSKKTLNICLAGTGVGKSLFMCHTAAQAMMQGKNVLYITLEMAEERIAERIDANLMNLDMDDLKAIDKGTFQTRIQRLADKTHGKLVIKEYPTGSAHSGHFRALIEELKIKKDFVPDLLIIDYINICASARMRMGATVNSYSYIKAIAEELRGLGQEFNVPVLSATQTTRSGYDNSDVGLTDTSESFGLPHTADLMFALITSEDLEKLGQLMVKQLKNRYADLTKYKRFVIGVDKAKMLLFDCEESAQDGLADAGQDEPPTPRAPNWSRRPKKDELERDLDPELAPSQWAKRSATEKYSDFTY